METPPSAQRETLKALSLEVANLATELAEYAHWLSDIDPDEPDGVMLMNIHTTKALWARDLLVKLFAKLRNETH